MKKIIIFLGVLLFGAIGFSQNFTFGNDFLNNHETQELEIGLFDFVSCPSQYELVKNETKRVWVDDGPNVATTPLLVVGGIMGGIGVIAMLTSVIIEPIPLWLIISGGAVSTVGLGIMVIGICLPNEGHYEERYVYESKNMNIYSNVSFSYDKHVIEKGIGIKIKI